MRTLTITASLMALLLAPFVAANRADAAEDVARASAAPEERARERAREVDGGLLKAMRCMASCQHRGPGRDKCLESCARRAERLFGAPATSTLEQLSACIDDCYSDKSLRRTDRETCKLTCSQVASLHGPKLR
jgi:hypothetical protein